MTSLSILKGNAGQNPELRTTPSGVKVATYSLAVYRPNPKDKENPSTDWFNVVAWGEQAELTLANVTKGTKVLITGKFQTRSYENKEGKKITVTEFFQDDIGIVPRKEETGSTHPEDEMPF